MMARSLILGLLMVTWCAVIHRASADSSSSEESRPNFVVIMADDMGWNDIGYNNPDVITPNLVQLAKDGRKLTHHYANSICSPSRSSLLTGRYPHAVQMQHFVLANSNPHCVPTDVTFLPEKLQQLGYQTHLAGKWHLGFCKEACLPNSRGFDTFYGTWAGTADQYRHSVTGAIEIYDFHNNELVDKSVINTHSTDVFTDRAVEIIEEMQNGDDPLFLYVAYKAPHLPLQAPQKFMDMYPNHEGFRKNVMAMLSHMDDGVGRIVQALEDAGMRENTLIVFLSDNGGDPVHFHSNHPLRGGKGSVYEGGTRTVAFVNGPMVDTSSEDGDADGLFSIIDWAPTLLLLAGGTPDDEVDGIDQREMLLEGKPSNRVEFVYHMDMEAASLWFGQAAIRVGPYKLIWGADGYRDGWEDNPLTPDGASFSWEMPWNMELLGLDPETDKEVRDPNVIPPNGGTPVDRQRRAALEAIKKMDPADIDSGYVYLYDIEEDETEERNLAELPGYESIVLAMKDRVLDILDTEYLKPHPLRMANWFSEAAKVLGPEVAFNTGWCNNVTITVN